MERLFGARGQGGLKWTVSSGCDRTTTLLRTHSSCLDPHRIKPVSVPALWSRPGALIWSLRSYWQLMTSGEDRISSCLLLDLFGWFVGFVLLLLLKSFESSPHCSWAYGYGGTHWSRDSLPAATPPPQVALPYPVAVSCQWWGLVSLPSLHPGIWSDLILSVLPLVLWVQKLPGPEGSTSQHSAHKPALN